MRSASEALRLVDHAKEAIAVELAAGQEDEPIDAGFGEAGCHRRVAAAGRRDRDLDVVTKPLWPGVLVPHRSDALDRFGGLFDGSSEPVPAMRVGDRMAPADGALPPMWIGGVGCWMGRGRDWIPEKDTKRPS